MNKKIILACVLGLFLTLSVTSCKKDQTCSCTTTRTDLNPNPDPTETLTADTKIKDTKKKAKDKCEKLNSSTTDALNYKTEVKCVIK